MMGSGQPIVAYDFDGVTIESARNKKWRQGARGAACTTLHAAYMHHQVCGMLGMLGMPCQRAPGWAQDVKHASRSRLEMRWGHCPEALVCRGPTVGQLPNKILPLDLEALASPPLGGW